MVNIIKVKIIQNMNICSYLKHFYRMISTLYVSEAVFVVTVLIVNDSLFTTDNYIDLTYVATCLITLLFYTVNGTTINETLILFGCKKREISQINEVFEVTDNDNDKCSKPMEER